MANRPQKRSVTLAGHRTSISLEPIFWRLLNDAAEAAGKSIGAYVAWIDERRTANLSSSIRTHLVQRLIEER